jgi:hypothetical protein
MLDVTAPSAGASSAPARLPSSDSAAHGAARNAATTSPAAERVSAGGAVFYRYHDESGRLVIVDSLARVPSSARGAVETVELAPAPGLLALPTRFAQDFHGPSFIAGAAAALALGLVWLLLRRSQGGRVVRWVLLAGVVMAGSGAYLGWVRRTTGQGDSLVASPAALIDDARSAVQKMNERSREQQQVLKDLEAER